MDVEYDILDVEKSVIGSLLIDPQLYAEMAQFLPGTAFHIRRNGMIYDAIGRLIADGKQVDYVTVCSELDRVGLFAEIGGASYLLDAINAGRSPIDEPGVGEIVRETTADGRLRASRIDGQRQEVSVERAVHLVTSLG